MGYPGQYPPYGRGPYGGPYGGPNGGNRGGYGGGGDNEVQSDAMREYIYPATEMTFLLKEAEADMSDDAARRRAFFTDGRKLEKSKDDNYREIAAHWEGKKLVSEEKTANGTHLRRTFELSQDGRQLDEYIYLDATKSRGAVTIHYLYDINSSRH